MEEDEKIGLMVWGKGLEANAAWEGLEMFWGTLRSVGRYSELWGCSAHASATHSDKGSLVTSTLGYNQLCWGCHLGLREASGLSPPVLAQDQWQWRSLASLMIPRLNEDFIIVCPVLAWAFPFPSAMPDPIGWSCTHLHDPCPHSQLFLLLM